jgi:hypothetical protein
VDRPQVRTPDGFVLRRTGGYNIYEIALGAGGKPPVPDAQESGDDQRNHAYPHG